MNGTVVTNQEEGLVLNSLASNSQLESEILRLEEEFGKAMIGNDADSIGRFLSDDWIIIDADGGIVSRARFLEVIRSGALTHKAMASEDIRVRVYRDSATVTALTTSRTDYQGHEFTTKERATDVFVKQNGQWRCVLTHLTSFPKK